MAHVRRKRWSAAEAARLMEGFERSRLTRREYCERAGVAVATLDYLRRRQAQRHAGMLVPVKIVHSPPRQGFALVLGNGRRIEGSWDFAGEDLSRLVRIAEQA